MIASLAATLVSAVCFALAFPPTRWHALAWVSLVPLFVVLRDRGRVAGPVIAAFWAVVMAYLLGQWMAPAIARYYDRSWAFGIGFFVACATVTAGVYYAAFAAAYRLIARTPPALRPLFTATAWVATELARGRLFTGTAFFIGNPWALLGYSQVGAGPHVQVAALGGVYGVGFLVVLVNAVLVELWLAWRTGRGWAVVATWSVVVTLVVGASSWWGRAAIAAGDVASDAGGTTPIAVVQAHLDVGAQWREDMYGENLAAYLDLTRHALAGAPRVVFWPEGAMTFHLDREPIYRAQIAATLGPAGVDLVAGGPHAVDVDAGYRNAIFLLRPDGRVAARYDKQYLVPFAEYFPFAELDFLRRRFDGVRVFSPGDGGTLLPTAAGRAGVLVCNEAMLPEVVGARVAEGAEYLVNPANDSWLDDGTYSALQLDIVLLRAVEQRRWLVRASTSGPSAVIDPFGRVRAATAPLAREVLHGRITAQRTRTVYGRVGDLFAFLAVGVAVAGMLAGRRRPGRSIRRRGHAEAR